MTYNQLHGILQNCPYLRANRKECYCVDITSSKVRDAIRYCGTNYLDCPLFEKFQEQSRIVRNPEALKTLPERKDWYTHEHRSKTDPDHQ